MNTWLNKFCPGFMTLPRKPHPFGNEYHSITDGNGRKLITWRIKIVKGKDRLKKANGTWAFPSKYERTWLAMLANVSVGYTPQTTDIFVCCQHVGNVVPKMATFCYVGQFFAVAVVRAIGVALVWAVARAMARARARARGWTGGGKVEGVGGGICSMAKVVAILARQRGSVAAGRRRRAARQQGG
jgi:hypothetical protein